MGFIGIVSEYTVMLNIDGKKRRLSVEDYETQPPQKKSVVNSIRSYVLGAFGFKKSPQLPKLINDINVQNRAVPDSSEKPTVTAKQLHNYYLSLKNENSSLFNDLAEVKTSTRANPELDSFILNNKDAESTMIKEQQDGTVNGISNKETDIITPNIANDSIKSASTTIYNNSILPDPLERANLIQLKKMMELDRYKKLRMNYLRKHTRHLDRSGIAKMAKELKEKKKLNSPMKSIKDVPLTRRNTSGIFGISLLNKLAQDYDDDEEELEKEELNPVKVEPSTISQKLKFNSKSQLDESDIINKRKTVVPEKQMNIKLEKSQPTAPVKITSEKPTIPEVLPTTEETGPSSGFSFGGSAPSLSIPKVSESKPLFGSDRKVTIEELKETDEVKPASSFKFGGKSGDATSFSFSKPAEKKDDTKPAFSFGASTENKEESKPAFSFATSTEKKNEKKQEPKLTFSALTEKVQDKPAEASLFSFSKPAEQKEEQPPSSFFFNPVKPKESAAPAFSFSGSSEKKETSTPTTPAFSLGAPSNDVTKPALSFGASIEKKDETKPSFSFGQSTEKKEEVKPSFSFGAPPQKKEDSPAAPAFSFGGASTEKKEDKPAASSFSFGGSNGSTESKSGFSFGAPAEKKEETKPSFSFGQSAAPEKKESTPGFSFGQSADKKDPSPAFSFGSNKRSGSPMYKDKVPSLSFNQKSEAEKPSESTPTPSTIQPFKFESSASDPPAFAKMGMNNLGVETKPSSKGFGFAADREQSKSNNAMFNSSSATAKPAFGFGMNNQSAEKKDTPAFGFNPQSNNNNNTTPGQPASSFSFGNNAQSSNNNNGSGFSFGSNNGSTTGFSQSSTQPPQLQQQGGNTGFGFGSGPASAVTSGGNTPNTFNFGGNNNSNPAGKIFSMNNSNFSSAPGAPSSTGFGMGANNNNGGFGMNQQPQFTGANAGPPNMNFTGGQTQQMDPSMIFQGGGNPTGAPRKMAHLRSRRGNPQSRR